MRTGQNFDYTYNLYSLEPLLIIEFGLLLPFEFLTEDMVTDFSKKGGEREKERNIDVKEKHLPIRAPTGDQTHILGENQTRNILVFRTML